MSYKANEVSFYTNSGILHPLETITLEFWYLPGCQASKSKMADVRDFPKQHDV